MEPLYFFTRAAYDLRENVAELFAKYHYRILPVVDEKNAMLGIVRYKDIMKNYSPRAKV